MSDGTPQQRLTKKIAATTGGTAAPSPKPGSAPSTRNRYGDVLSPTRSTNHQPSRFSFAGAAGHGNARAGMHYQTGATKSGNVVHYYANGERVVLNKKATPSFKRTI